MDNILIIIIAAFAVVFVLLIVLYAFFNRKSDDSWKVEIKKKLVELRARLNNNDPIILKSVVIDADQLLDYTLKKKGFKGETMGERLKSAKNSYDWATYNAVWEAHKLRNTLVHELNSGANYNTAKLNFHSLEKGIEKII